MQRREFWSSCFGGFAAWHTCISCGRWKMLFRATSGANNLRSLRTQLFRVMDRTCVEYVCVNGGFCTSACHSSRCSSTAQVATAQICSLGRLDVLSSSHVSTHGRSKHLPIKQSIRVHHGIYWYGCRSWIVPPLRPWYTLRSPLKDPDTTYHGGEESEAEDDIIPGRDAEEWAFQCQNTF